MLKSIFSFLSSLRIPSPFTVKFVKGNEWLVSFKTQTARYLYKNGEVTACDESEAYKLFNVASSTVLSTAEYESIHYATIFKEKIARVIRKEMKKRK